jgi:predicted TIM-barrel fold metal-dependent hydrolase
MRYVDTEAHFWTDEFVAFLRERSDPPKQVKHDADRVEMWFEPSAPELSFTIRQRLVSGLNNLGDERIAAMDAAGIDVAILSLSGPGLDNLEPELQVEWSRRINDELGAYVAKHPGRLYGMAVLSPAEPEAAAEELERCVREYGFVGANVHSHGYGGAYYDHPRFRPMWAAAARLGTPVNLHPIAPHMQMLKPYLGYGWALPGPGQGFGNETALHVMRLIYSGLFDEYPDLKLTLGHFGEALTFWVYRIDFDFTKDWLDPAHRPKIERKPSEYLKRNFWLNCSGNFVNSALLSTLMEVGADRLMWASDYAWAPMEEARAFIDDAPLADADREKICWSNAVELFGLDDPLPS